MEMKKFKRYNRISDKPVISLGDDKFQYNAALSKLAGLKEKEYVVYHFDTESREIGFEFLKARTDEHAYKLIKSAEREVHIRSSAGGLIKCFSWVKAIHNSRFVELKRFNAFKRGNLWVIRLKPAFEMKVKRSEIHKIPRGVKGIYRYVTQEGVVVYIGKGDIRMRVKKAERRYWNFDQIEYSIIEDENKQYEWEDYWIEWYKGRNDGKLPYYNKISGIKSQHPDDYEE
jgi:hypothetical protein